MSHFTSVFQKPGQAPYFYPMHGDTLRHEIASAKSIASDPDTVFGTYLYSRPVRQVLMRTGERYAFNFYDPALYLRYRKHDEVLNGSFDYYRVGGPNQDTVILHVDHQVEVVEGGFSADVCIKLKFTHSRTFKFRELCKDRLVAIEVGSGKVMMRIYDSAHAYNPSFELPLEVVR
jgi:hypothetical protein